MFLEHYRLYWKNYTNFKGRTPRSGYWFVFLWNVIINTALSLIVYAIVYSSAKTALGGLLGAYSDPFGFLSNPFSTSGDVFSGVFGGAIGLSIMSVIIMVWSVANIIPGLSIAVRRLHDTGRRWFWLLISFGPAILLAIYSIILVANPYSALFGGMGILAILLIVTIVCEVVYLILMCLPTSPNAIGASTHGMYPQWQDGRGRQDEGGACIVGITGMYKGAVFPIDEDEELILGRDAMLSHIVITENAEKVSRKHLTVSFDSYDNVYVVTDNSSNGTYLADGTRVVANIPVKLQRGTIIYLAKKENTFKLV